MTTRGLEAIREVFNFRQFPLMIVAGLSCGIILTILFNTATDYPVNDTPVAVGTIYFLLLIAVNVTLQIKNLIVRFIFRKYHRVFHQHEKLFEQLDDTTKKDVERRSRQIYWTVQLGVVALAFGISVLAASALIPRLYFTALPELIVIIGVIGTSAGMTYLSYFFGYVLGTCRTLDNKMTTSTATTRDKPGWLERCHRALAELAAKAKPATPIIPTL